MFLRLQASHDCAGLTNNLKFHQQSIILGVPWLANQLNRGKSWVTQSIVVVRCHWSLTCLPFRLSHQGFADITMHLFVFRLIQDGQSQLFSKWPFQEIIVITLHQMNEQCHVFANTIIHTIHVDSHAQVVPRIQTGVK